MELSFKQRRFFNTRKIIVTNTGLDIENGSLNGTSKGFLPFTELGFHISKASSYNKKWIFGAAFCMFGIMVIIADNLQKPKPDMAGNLLLYTGLLLFFLAGYYIMGTRVYIYQNFQKKPGVGFLSDPDKDKRLNSFITQLKDIRNKYLINEYGTIDKNMPPEAVKNNLLWLRNMDAINDIELGKLLSELEENSKHNKIIGFGKV